MDGFGLLVSAKDQYTGDHLGMTAVLFFASPQKIVVGLGVFVVVPGQERTVKIEVVVLQRLLQRIDAAVERQRHMRAYRVWRQGDHEADLALWLGKRVDQVIQSTWSSGGKVVDVASVIVAVSNSP